MNKFLKVCEYILFFLFFILLFFMTSKLSTLLVIPFIFILYLFVKKTPIKNYALFIFLLAFIVRLISIFYLKTTLADDFKTMYDASKNLINGNLSFLNEFYFKTFAYQLGHVLYQAFFLKIINSIFFLKLINTLITSLITLFIYLISKNLFKEKVARFTSLFYLFFLYPIYLNSVLTNQHLPALLVLITIYLIITKKINYKLSILIGLILGLANIFRTESIIIILGILVYNFCFVKKKTFRKTCINSLLLVISYFLFNFMVGQLVYISPINFKLNNTAPEWKFYCGLSDKYNGIYNQEDQEVFFNSNNKKELLTNRVKENSRKLPLLFLKKEVILWTQTNYDIRITNNINSNLYNFILLFNQGYLNLILILFIISLFPRKEKIDKNLLFIKIIIGIYYCVYMFIEVSPRYAYILYILMFLLLGSGISRINSYLPKFKNIISTKKI